MDKKPKSFVPIQRMRFSQDEDGHNEPGHHRWLLTYADMITLLLVLFVVMFAISAINMKKYREFKQSATQAIGSHVALTTTTTPAPSKATSVASLQARQLTQIHQQLIAALTAKGLAGDVNISSNSAGLAVGLATDSAFFGTDNAQLDSVGKEIVDVVASVLKSYPNAIEVAGYTDNQPITGGPYPNNWALSAARATTVVVRMTKRDGVAPSRVVLIGFGQYHPLASNSTPVGRAENRRVNIIVSPGNGFTP